MVYPNILDLNTSSGLHVNHTFVLQLENQHQLVSLFRGSQL